MRTAALAILTVLAALAMLAGYAVFNAGAAHADPAPAAQLAPPPSTGPAELPPPKSLAAPANRDGWGSPQVWHLYGPPGVGVALALTDQAIDAGAEPPGSSTGLPWVEIWAVVASVLAAALAFLRFLAPRTKNTVDDSIADSIAEILGLLRPSAPAATTTAPARNPQAGRAQLVTMLAIVALGMAPIVAATSGCATVKPRAVAAAKVELGCQAPSVIALVTESLVWAKDWVISRLDSSGRPDKAALREAFRNAKSDAPRCLLAAAISAAATPPPGHPGAPMAAGLEVDGDALRAVARELAAAEWGVTGVIITPSGAVL